MPSYFYHLNIELCSVLDTNNEPSALTSLQFADLFNGFPIALHRDLQSEHMDDSISKHHQSQPSQQPLAWEIHNDTALNSSGHRSAEGLTSQSVLPVRDESPKAVGDWRFGQITVETPELGSVIFMAGETSKAGSLAAPSLGPSYGGSGTATKAKFLPLRSKSTDLGWGVVHFYREEAESSDLTGPSSRIESEVEPAGADCTTLCIPAVPSYMSPGEVLGFIGQRWMDNISHCRMVMTAKLNSYLVLLKFRSDESALSWRKEFDGTVFNTMEVRREHLSRRLPFLC